MSNITPDSQFPTMLARASEPFRRICAAVSQELQSGEPAKAYALVDELTSTKQMGPVDRRCMLSLRVALRAIVELRAAGLPPAVDLRHYIGFTPAFALDRRYLPAVQSALAGEVSARTAMPLACPNCGSAGTGAGWVHPVRGSGVPHGRFYVDPDATVARALPGEPIDPVHAHLLVTLALANLRVRVPVLACDGCGLRYVSWRRDSSVEERYAAPPGGGFELAGEQVFGRANTLTHTYDKAALPLHLERVLGGVRGLSMYEFGCAEGVMAALLADLGATVSGSDLDRPKVRYGRSILGLTGLSDDGDYFWSLPAHSLDCLYAFHSVEHVLRPDDFFDQFARTLKPGGFLVVAVPHVTLRDTGEVTDMGGDHLVGYDRAVLEGFFRRHDPVRGLPNWSGRPADMTIVGRRPAA